VTKKTADGTLWTLDTPKLAEAFTLAGRTLPDWSGVMFSLDMHRFVHWVAAHGNIVALVVTAGVALLIGCCLSCSNCGCREKDELFKRREV
jgi:hypothetical protein